MPKEIGGYTADTPTVSEMLGNDTVTLVIPAFQRTYSWSRNQIDELLSDLYEYDQHWLDDDYKAEPYFLGAIVTAKDSVLDGQQRLATVSLLLAILGERLRAANQNTAAIDKCLSSQELGGPPTLKLRLQEDDRFAYEQLLASPTAAADESSPVPTSLQAKDLRAFKKHPLVVAARQLISALDSAGGRSGTGLLADAHARGFDQKAGLLRLAQRLLYGVWFVLIGASDESAAFRLFETLNDRGLDLSAADLVKNKLLERSGAYRPEVEETWKDVVESVRPEMVDFLRHYWVAFHSLVRHEQLYREIRKHIESLTPEQIRDFANSLSSSANTYRSLMVPRLGPWDPATATTLERLLAYRARSCRPALLVAAKAGEERLRSIASAAEVVSVRHTLVGDRNRNVIERTYYDLATALREKGAAADVVGILGKIVPTDEEFRKDFREADVPTATAGWREILARLNDEHYVGTGETRIADSSKVHIEHLLPLKPSATALAESGFKPEDAAEAGLAARRIGNLTLLAGRKNQAASNQEFSKKQPILKTSKIAMNVEIAQKADGSDRPKWDLSAINERADRLADAAVKIWAWPPS